MAGWRSHRGISVVVNYEEGSEASLLDGDGYHETNNEVPSPVPAGQRDLFNESFFEYGSRVGVWRILNLLDKYSVKSTFFSCAVAFERNPEVARAVVERGHEVCGHGYRWEEYHNKTRDEEAEAIRMTVESLTRTTGERPVGWFTRYGPSVNTRELVVEEGGFIYDSGVFNDDLPYYTEVHGKPWPVLPYSFETNDARFWRGGTQQRGRLLRIHEGHLRRAVRGRPHPPQDDVSGVALSDCGPAGPFAGFGPVPAVRAQPPGCLVCATRRDCPVVVGELSARDAAIANGKRDGCIGRPFDFGDAPASTRATR